jgi:hypothetical protein
VLPLFAEHLEQVDGSVSAEWFHERVSEARAQIRQGTVTPAEHCREWVEKRWLETETLNGRLRYRLSPYSLRALRFVRELVEGETTGFSKINETTEWISRDRNRALPLLATQRNDDHLK